jgi:hypothetical protein
MVVRDERESVLEIQSERGATVLGKKPRMKNFVGRLED